jgi:hypothetical protein
VKATINILNEKCKTTGGEPKVVIGKECKIVANEECAITRGLGSTW